MLDYETRKATIQTLPSDELWVMTALVAWGDKATVGNLVYLLNGARLAKTRGVVWQEEGVKSILREFEREGYARMTSGGTTTMTAEWRPAIMMGTYLLHPEVTARLAARTYQFLRYGEKNNYRSRNLYRSGSGNYSDYPRRCLLLLLQNKWEDFEQLYSELTSRNFYFHVGSIADTKKEIDRLFSYFDADFWLSFHPYFHSLALTETVGNTKNWDETTAEHICVYLSDLPLDPYYEVDHRETQLTAGMMTLQEVPNWPKLQKNFPGLTAVAKLLKGDRAATAPELVREPIHDQILDLPFLVGCLYRLGAGEMTAARLVKSIKQIQVSHTPAVANSLRYYLDYELGKQDHLEPEQLYPGYGTNAIEWMVTLWCGSWLNIRPLEEQVLYLKRMLQQGGFGRMPWVTGEIYNSLALLLPGTKEQAGWKREAEQLAERHGFTYLQNMVQVRAAWERAFQVLDQLNNQQAPTTGSDTERETRLIWLVDFDTHDIYPKEQKQGKKGWTSGRKLNWSEFVKEEFILEDRDEQVIAALVSRDGKQISPHYYYSNDNIQVYFSKALYQLAGHPLVFMDEKKRIPLTLKRGTPELQVTETEDGLLLRFDPPASKQGYVYQKDTPTRYTIYKLTEEQAQLARVIGEATTVPNAYRKALEDKLPGIRNKVAVLSSTDLINGELPELAGSPKPCVQLLPFGDAFKLELYARPLPEESYYFKPGDGLPRSIVAQEDGRAVLVRDLAAERAEVEALIAACPTLAGRPHDSYEWQLDDVQAALRVLLELRGLLAQGTITLEHPRGEKLKLVSVAGSDDLRLQINKSRDWFQVSGDLRVDENRVIDFELLLEHAANGDGFIKLATGEFAALTDELRERILGMEGLLHQRGKKRELPTLAAGHFAELAEGLDDLEVDELWQESLERIKLAQNSRPTLPKNFNAELRDYQLKGFDWLMRLATWGVGGCLADDMGLGKTVQALAVLTKRAQEGPALVIAPASVTRNWRSETERFAPELIPILLAGSADVGLLSELGKGDLLLVSYGLLPFIGEELAEIPFATIVLDEAQAIKNPATKRAQVVNQLQGDFKIATTGTPIENHLGELWSLFRFLNPGLLGSREAFGAKYERPIVKDDDAESREQLRRLVQPFILRRRKENVLKELPAKTEIILNVTLSAEERALYEAMRRQALKEIADADEQARRFVVLSQLTRMRQASCHPRLVRKKSKVPSAKLQLVGETILELIENGHKALVFSQFVQHLKLVEDWVRSQDIAYQYLDGSTPGKKRQEYVDAFQSGEGDLFLISLKAGGTGLNLTAADYVLHLDPWWNPAVEDQASDRAHRMGQQRPVTVYRFVSEDTIEEQIIALHQEKRDLADQILSGTSKSGQLGVEEILRMLKGE
ncbi:MAG: DEAD/DEAH box helicase [Saprospiraceae bacterium]